MPQAGKVFWYVRADANHDISADSFSLSIDGGTTWLTDSVTFIAPDDWPPDVAAVDADYPLKPGFIGHWWRFYTGGSTSFPLALGNNLVLGRAVDDPEEPQFHWTIYVDSYT